MKRYIHRHGGGTRFNHWVLVLLFGLAGFSGLALFHPNLFFLTQFFGGPQWARIVHPYLGIGVFLAFLFMFFRVWQDNLAERNDRAWLDQAGNMIKGDKKNMPPVGKYNAGQKIVFWLTLLCLIVLLATGVLFWQDWFARSVPIPVQRVAVVLHALSAFAISLLVCVHIYAAIWVKGTIRGMTQGTVSAGWAKQNHYLWYKKVGRGNADRS